MSVCRGEEQFLQHANDRITNFPEGWKVEELLFEMRYVDDLLMVSYTSGCSKFWPKSIPPIFVNAEEYEQTFTDVVFQVGPIILLHGQQKIPTDHGC